MNVPLGEVAVLVGPTGSGKSTLALAVAVSHARVRGPALYISCEMPPPFVGGRVVGQAMGRAWPDVLRGEVGTADMTNAMPARFCVVDRRDAINWQRAAETLASRYPTQPLVVVVDYLQILPAPAQHHDMRVRVTQAVDEISAWAIDARALVIVVSQTSRAAARALRSGESVGWAATDAGAESAAIERAAHVVLAIGERGSDREDGSCEVTLSIGKHRMGRGDEVVSAAYHGAHGRWSALGAPRRADVAKAERDAARDDRRIDTAAAAAVGVLAKAREPMSRTEVRSAIAMGNAATRAAISRLIAAAAIVEIEAPGRGGRKLWTPDRARAAKAPIVHQTIEAEEEPFFGDDGGKS